MKRALVLTAAFTTVFFVSLAQAKIRMQLVPFSMACGPHEDLLEVIKNNHKERLLGRALTHNSGLAELFVNADGGWSFLLTPKPNQVTCVLTSGEHWQILDGETDGTGEDSAEW